MVDDPIQFCHLGSLWFRRASWGGCCRIHLGGLAKMIPIYPKGIPSNNGAIDVFFWVVESRFQFFRKSPKSLERETPEAFFGFKCNKSIESFLLFAMGCNATKAEISSFEKDSSNMDQLQPFSSWDITSKQVLHEAARGFPPTRRTHERHLLALDRFLQGVQACPHGFNKTVEQYRAALKAAEHMEMDYMEESNEPMISVDF